MPEFYHDLATDKIVTEEYFRAHPLRFSIVHFGSYNSLQEAQDALDRKYPFLKADPKN